MDYIIEMNHIVKEFPGIRANDDITLQVKKGEIHALLGENGAGKSTLMSVLFGMYKPEGGNIKLRGEQVSISGPKMANELGIGMVHQHFMLVHNFTVLQNIILGVETTRGGFLKNDKAREKVMALSKLYGLSIDPDALISDITVGMQQRVEILKMLYRDNEILIFDEPTAVLTPQEIDELMGIMKNLAAEGKSLIFITHKLEEIKRVADRCTVLRLGKCVGTVNVADVTVEQMSEMMVGRKVILQVNKQEKQPGAPVLEVNKLTVRREGFKKNRVHDLKIKVNEGEIVSKAGAGGNGQPENNKVDNAIIHLREGEIVYNDRVDASGQPQKFKVHKGEIVYNLGADDAESVEEDNVHNFDIRVYQGEIVYNAGVNGSEQPEKVKARNVDLRVHDGGIVSEDADSRQSVKDKVHRLSLKVHEGEIVCIAGVDGNGQSELIYALSGLISADSGTIKIKGENVTHKSIRYRNTHGLSHIPEDRHKYGLVLDYTLGENLVLLQYFMPQFQSGGFLKNDEIQRYAQSLIEKFDIRSSEGARTKARSMSGGNQQKAIVAREINRDPDLLLAVQPTRGLDVGAIEYMHRQIISARDRGKAVLVVSFELSEVMQLADRILVMFEGEIVANVKPSEVTENELGLYMAGAKRGSAG